MGHELDSVLPGGPASGEAVSFVVRIHTFGRFEVVRRGECLMTGGRPPKRPLSMLKAIINSGGTEVNAAHIIDMLWPESDGDAAQISFDTTLHRLRRLLGNNQAVRLRAGRLGLDPSYCWVDAWAFNDVAGRIIDLSGRKAASGITQCILRLLPEFFGLYRGHYLDDEDGYWAVPVRERLRAKFITSLVSAGMYLEDAGEHDLAIESFRKGLDRDRAAEEFYQHLMLCYREIGQENRAMAVYDLCRTTLAAILGLGPSTKTEDIYASLTGDDGRLAHVSRR